MKRVAVIGAGIAGLSVARLLNRECDVTVYEQNSRPGGLLRCDRIDGNLFHRCGGHVFNTKNQAVFEWFKRLFDFEKDFVSSRRNAVVCLENGQLVPYPIENHVYMLGEAVRTKIFQELTVRAKDEARSDYRDFDAFLRGNFGDTLYGLYFDPYNQKIWQQDLTQIPLQWLEGKLPMTSPREILAANAGRVQEQSMVHSSFWYPKNDGSQFLVDLMARGLRIETGKRVCSIRLEKHGGCRVNDEFFDAVFFCGDVRKIPEMIGSAADSYGEDLEGLRCHGTTAVFCRIDGNPYSWIYQPNRRHSSHRIICTGNFSASNNARGECSATVEFTGSVRDDDIVRQLALMPFNPRHVTSEYTPCTYPIQREDTRKLIDDVRRELREKGVFLVGRFAEWEYFNMDAVVASAMREVDAFRNIYFGRCSVSCLEKKAVCQ